MNLLKKHGKVGAILLLGILLGSLMITPAEGHPQPFIGGGSSGSVTACIGTTPGNGSVKIARRVISSTTLMEYSPTGSCPAGESAIQWNSYVRTVLVSPTSGGTAVQNGAALIAAMATITTATSTNPWLLKVEPGLYDLNGQSLTMQPYVDLEGSGENTTVISSTVGSSFPPTAGTLIAASYDQARFLTIANSGFASQQLAVYASALVTGTSFIHLTTTASGGSNTNYGIGNYGTITVQNSTISASAGSNISFGISNNGTMTVQNSTISTSGGLDADGVQNFSGTMTVQNSTISASGASGNNDGIYNNATLTVQNSVVSASAGYTNDGINNYTGTITVQNSTVTASDGSNQSTGIYSGGTITVQNSNVIASGSSSSSNQGIKNGGGMLTVQNSTISASGSSGSSNHGIDSYGTTIVQNSNAIASGTISAYGIYNLGGSIHVGASGLFGTTAPSGTSSGTFTCVGDYNSNTYVALGTNCV